MSEESIAAPGGGEGIVVPVITPTPAETSVPTSASEAARQLSAWRQQKRQQAAQPAPAAPEVAAAAPELAETPSSDPQPEVPAETPEAPEPEAELPPIEPPRSWTKEEKAEFATYPREAQEKIARREQERETAVRRSQNEAAEKLKGLTAKEQAVEQARQAYEAKLPAVMQALQDAQAGAFPDIKSMEDVTKLAAEDPFRYLQWQAHQSKMQAVHYEMTEAQNRQAQEHQTKWREHVAAENALAAEAHPELADPVKSKALQEAAVSLLQDKGFKPEELTRLATGEDKLSIYDHRIQSLLLDGVKYRDAKAAVSKPAPKPVPLVQRPGAAPSKGAQVEAQIAAAANRLSTAKGTAAINAAADLLKAQRQTARR